MGDRPGNDQANHPAATAGGRDTPADALAEARAVIAKMSASLKDSMKNSQAEVGREELGQLPSQDPPRHRPRL
jgi:hypothetical protein